MTLLLIAHSHEGMQEIVTHFAGTAKAFGPQVNLKKGDDVPAIPRYWWSPPTHTNIGWRPSDNERFKCLGSTATYNNKLDTELQLQKSKSSQAFGRLKGKSLVQQKSYNQDQMCCLFYHCVINLTLWSGILDNLHDPSSQLECLHNEAPDANPGCQMVASNPQPRYPDEN